MGRWNLIERRLERFLREPPSVRNAAGVIVMATAAVVVGAGVLISLLDSKEYPNVWIGMWYALQTVTTVGYGDVTPTELGGRLVGVLLMLQGTAFIAIVTAAITSTFVARAQKATDAERASEEVSDRQAIDKRFDELERKLDLIATAPDESGS
jgi:voltage-gated potassium channel